MSYDHPQREAQLAVYSGSLAFQAHNYLVRFDPNEDRHVNGFVSLLMEQGDVAWPSGTREQALFVANAIGQEFQVTFICGDLDGHCMSLKE